MKKKLNEYSFFDRLFLLRLTNEADKTGFMLVLTLINHWLNLLAFAISCIGFIGTIVTLGKGWALTLLAIPGISMFFHYHSHRVCATTYLLTVRTKQIQTSLIILKVKSFYLLE